MSYIRTLEKAIRSYHIQEFNTPSRCVPHYEHEDPEEWQTANRLWKEWMELCWNDVAAAHAGAELTDAERSEQYGR